MADQAIPRTAKTKSEASLKRQALLDTAGANRQAVDEAKIAEVDKTARLRALRLAKEQADEEVAALQVANPAPKPKRVRAAKPKPSVVEV